MRSQITSQAVFALGVIGLALQSPAGARADGDPIGKCCFEDSQGAMQCDDLTESQCSAAGDPHLWEEGRFCGQDGIGCPLAECIGTAGSCMVIHQIPGCNHPYCCTEVCTSHGAVGAFCCNVTWDATCVALAEMDCELVPANDECAPGPGVDQAGALNVPVPGSRATNNTRATTSASDPGFCCHGGVSSCVGGANDGLPCVVAADCPSGSCPQPSPMPGALGYGSIWFKFVPPPGQTRAGISTCTSNPPALDSVLQVFRATDHSSPQNACASLVPIACKDDTPNCSSTQRNSRVCLEGLIPGQTYYIAVAAKTPNRLGQYIVSISTNCTSGDFSCPNTSVLGACCDTHGQNHGCTNGVSDADCRDSDETWFADTQCETIPCECVPQCGECGDDECGGSCGECDDADACNGLESCHEPTQQCQAGAALVCDDENVCNGQEFCDPVLGCQPGTPLHCADGNACNGVETCHPVLGCRPGTPMVCDDGLFCNGLEFCSEAFSRCLDGEPPCDDGQICDEESDQCMDAPIPAVSAWGLTTLALLFLIAAKIRVRHNAAY